MDEFQTSGNKTTYIIRIGGIKVADIFTLIDEYKGLMDEKDRLKDATTENNKELEKKRNELA